MRFRIAIALAMSLAAQDRRFGVESRLVLVPVMVTDAKGRSIDGLEAGDFQVLDNGRPQVVAVDSFATGVAPIALVVAVQSSGISAAALAKVQKIGAMIQPMLIGQHGCAALLTFNERIEWIEECTNDADKLIGAFRRLRPAFVNRARMLDATHQAVNRLRGRTNVRRVLLLISESRDGGSESELETAAMASQAGGVTIYAATYSGFKTMFTAKSSETDAPRSPKPLPTPGEDPNTRPGRENIKLPPAERRVDILSGIGELARLGKTNTTEELAGMTGGTTFHFTRLKGLEEAIKKLSEELHTQYVISFAPDAPAPGYHRLEVKVVRQGKFNVRARPAYWAAQPAE